MPRIRTRIVPRGGASLPALTAPTPPAAQSLASTATTASATWTHSGAPAGTTYACTVLGSDGSTPTATGSELGAWTWPVVSSVAYEATLTATGSDGQTARSSALVQVQPDLAADFPVEGEAGWRVVFTSNLTAETPQGPLADGAGTVSIGGKTVPYLANATTGTFGVNNATNIGATGLVIATSSTAGQLPQITLDLPLSETITRENSLRVRVKCKVLNGDTTDSAFVYISDPAIDPDNNESSSARTGGVRLVSNAPSLLVRRGSAASSVQGVATTWADGTGDIYLTMIVPNYGNDVVILASSASFTDASAYRGRSNSRASNPEFDTSGSTFLITSWSTVKLMLAVANGSAGTGLPFLNVLSIEVAVR